MLFLILLITTASAIQTSESSNDYRLKHPIITTSSGRVKGNILKTRFDNEFYAFRGIRYGKPPINELRFKPPESAEFMDTIFDATTEGPACTQPYQPHLPKLTYSEDCLRLNVYTKNLPEGTKPISKKPVLMYIPGGAFYNGSVTTIDIGSPYFLMERDVVFVTINYRLGLLGFISLNSTFATGNIGLKDQVMALKWVKKNIEQFGGDSNAITVFGHSAGASSVIYHLVSPMSKNLFHRVIIMSPIFVYQEKMKSHYIKSARKQSKYLNCTEISTSDQIFNCFKNADSFALANSIFELIEFGEIYPIGKSNAVVETDFGQERFLVEDPWITFKSGNFTKVPIILGITSTEFSELPARLMLNKKYLKEFENRFNEVAPICLCYERGTEFSLNISRTLWNGYELSHPLTEKNLPSMVHLFHDAIVGYGVQRLLNIIRHSVDVFLYRFSYIGRFSQFYYPDDKPFGVQHADDLAYIFPIHVLYNRTDPESIIVEKVTRLWTQFALTGNPNNKTDEYISKIRWEPNDPTNNYYLEIDSEMSLKTNLRIAGCKEVWDKLFPEV